MYIWSKYKDYLFTTINVNINDKEIRVIYNLITKKTFFCFDDIMSAVDYKTDSNGSIQRVTSERYDKKIKMHNFIELFPNASFVSIDHIKGFPRLFAAVSNNNQKAFLITNIVNSVLRNFIDSFKNRKEIEIPENTENFIEIYKKQFSVATFNNETVVKVTDILRYCGYKTTSVSDNFVEYSIKIKTKFGVTNFIPLNKFLIIANEMANKKYSEKLTSLYNGFIKFIPKKESKVKINREDSVVLIDLNVIPFVILEDKLNFKTATIQKICGYKNKSLLDNFKNISVKLEDCHYVSIKNLKTLLKSAMSEEYKNSLAAIIIKLYKYY